MSTTPSLKKHRGVYVAQWTESGKRIRRSLGTNDEAEANRRLAHLKLTEDVLDRQTQKTIQGIFSRYIDEKTKEGKDTIRVTRAWKVLSPVFGSLYPQYITTDLVYTYCTNRKVSAGTIHFEVNLLRTVLNFGFKHGYISKIVYVPVPAKPAPKAHYLTRKQFAHLLSSTKLQHLKLFMILAITTGARSNAILDLTWDRVDLPNRVIDLRLPSAATNKGRAIVPINNTAFAALSEAYNRKETDHVIEYAGLPIRNIRQAIYRLSQTTKLKVSAHMFRHSAAVWMAEGGVPMQEIAQYLGHSNTAITERVYARFSPAYLRKAASMLEL